MKEKLCAILGLVLVFGMTSCANVPKINSDSTGTANGELESSIDSNVFSTYSAENHSLEVSDTSTSINTELQQVDWSKIEVLDEMDLDYEADDYYYGVWCDLTEYEKSCYIFAGYVTDEIEDAIDNGIKITNVFSDDKCLSFPDKIGEKSIVSVDPIVYYNANSVKLPSNVLYINGRGNDHRYGFGVPAPNGNNLVTIEEDAFSNCKSLENIIIPDSVELMEEGVFSGCVALEEVVLPKGISRIEDAMFWGCSSLKKVVFYPNSVSKIGAGAFYKCTSLTEIVIPEGVTTLESHQAVRNDDLDWMGAFTNCSNLKNVDIPDSVTYIGDKTFSGCSEDLTVNYKGKTYNSKNIQKLYDRDLSNL